MSDAIEGVIIIAMFFGVVFMITLLLIVVFIKNILLTIPPVRAITISNATYLSLRSIIVDSIRNVNIATSAFTKPLINAIATSPFGGRNVLMI